MSELWADMGAPVMTNRVKRFRILLFASLCVVTLPLSGIAIYGLEMIVGAREFMNSEHYLRQAFDALGFIGLPWQFSWSWSAILLAIYGIPHATFVFVADGILKRGRSFFRNSVETRFRILRFVCASITVFVVVLMSWRMLVEVFPTQLFATPPPMYDHNSRLLVHIRLLCLVSLPFSLICLLLENAAEALPASRSSCSNR